MKKLLLPIIFLCVISITGCENLNLPENMFNLVGNTNQCDKDDNGNPIPKEDCTYWAFYQSIENGMRPTAVIDLGLHYKINRDTHDFFAGVIETPSMGTIRIYYDHDEVVHKKWEPLN